MSKSGLPIDTFTFYGQKSGVMDEKQRDKKAELTPIETTEGNQRKSRRKNEDDNDLHKIFNDEEVVELPATQSPPKEPKYRLSNKSLFMNYPKKPSFENKMLNKLKVSERRKTMLSSPSIMTTKPARNEKLNEFVPTPKKQKASYQNDEIFDGLKKDSEPQNRTERVDEAKDELAGEISDITMKQSSSTSKTEHESLTEQDKSSSSKPALPVEKSQPSPKWLKINAESLRHLKPNTENFRLILDELKETNEKILNFRRAIARMQTD